MNITDANIITDMALKMEGEARKALLRVAETMDQKRPDLMTMATLAAVNLLERSLSKSLAEKDASYGGLYAEMRSIVSAALEKEGTT